MVTATWLKESEWKANSAIDKKVGETGNLFSIPLLREGRCPRREDSNRLPTHKAVLMLILQSVLRALFESPKIEVAAPSIDSGDGNGTPVTTMFVLIVCQGTHHSHGHDHPCP